MGEKEILLETGTNEFEILEFIIEEKLPDGSMVRHCFGVNVAKVVEVIESPNLASKDYAVNPCFLGTIPLRGMVLPVIDLSVWLGIKRNRHDYENIIVTEFSQAVQGFLVSGVVEIQRLNWKDLIPPGEYIRRLDIKSIIGVVDKDDHFIQLLDLEHIVSDLSPKASQILWETTVRASKEYRALVVEDSPTIQDMINKSLKISNFKVELVNNGEEAYRYLTDLKAKAKAEK
ncbi:MAG: chemotaxis protein CheW, partial [Nitrospirota bacterium]|nr:chemotaxis protein CheW [Nitrospirota bacterium]